MKHWRDSQKLFSILVIFAVVLFPALFLHAQTADELSSKINAKNGDIAKLEQEIAQYQTELNTIGKQKSSLNTILKQLDLTKKKLQADISVTQKKIANTNLKIQNLSSQIGVKEDYISTDNSAIATGIKDMNEMDMKSIVENILSDEDFTSWWNDLDATISVREKVIERIGELKEVKGQLEDTRKETVTAKNELVKLNNELADQKKIVDQNATEKNKLLKDTKNSEASYQKLLKDRLAKKDAFEKEMRDYESQLKFILDPSLLPKSRVFDWPLDNVFITQLFGKTEAGKRLYANGTHNGIDLRASVGTPVKAMADGIVVGVGDTDLTCANASFGKFVFIKYDNGLASTFGHFSLIKAYEGQRVSRGDIVGYSGNTGYSTGPHLHISVYAGSAVKMESRKSTACGGRTYYLPFAPINAYLDPMLYLPLYKY